MTVPERCESSLERCEVSRLAHRARRTRSGTPGPPVSEEKLPRPTHLPPEGAEPINREQDSERPRRRSSHTGVASPVLKSPRPHLLVYLLLAFSAFSALLLLLFGGHERAERIAVFREYIRQSDPILPVNVSGWVQILDFEEKFSFALKEIPLSPAVLSDFHDAGDLQHLPFGGEEHLDPPQDIVPEQKRLSRFWYAEVPLKLPEALEQVYLEAPKVTLQVSHLDGQTLLRHEVDLLREVEGVVHVPRRLCYALPGHQGPYGAEVLGCEEPAAVYGPATRPEEDQDLKVEVLLRSHADPYIIASHLTRGCSSGPDCWKGEDASCSPEIETTGAPFSSLLRRAELLNSRCFGRPRRLFRCYGLALLAFCAGVATAEAMLRRGSSARLRASVFTILTVVLLLASLRLLYE
ncbi:unnamed protein product [Durusdinium trenchii]|uniref:Transmembrane protein 231 n=1 Tax=Durusdinium trenchii TaxID=1381693 RepID=A0ABP0H9S6_9DINO